MVFPLRLAPLALATFVLIQGCSSSSPRQVVRAPVEDRTSGPGAKPAAGSERGSSPAASRTAPASTEPAPAPSGSRAPTYTVKPGDTLARIALDHGQSWRDVARWNNIENPNVIEVGQVLRVGPEPAGAAGSRNGTGQRAETQAVRPGGSGAAGAGPAREQGREEAGATNAAQPSASSASAPASAASAEADPAWIWPSNGPILTPFDETRSKGVALGGKAGDAVLAAADGRVVYAGSGLRGYGNLVILKHNATWLSAYAHNQTLLVKEDQVVKRGQKIAEMGSTDADRVQLHFEVRRQGKPVDPTRLLPAR